MINSNQQAQIFLQFYKLIIDFFRWTFLLGVFVVPLVLVIFILVALNIEWPFAVLQSLIVPDPELSTFSFSGKDLAILEFFSPVLFGIALVLTLSKWFLKKTLGINIKVPIKNKFLILISIITVIHILAAFLLGRETGDNGFYLVIAVFYVYSFISTVIYIGLELLLKLIDFALSRKIESPPRKTNNL